MEKFCLKRKRNNNNKIEMFQKKKKSNYNEIKNNNKTLDIPGFYFDIEKNRYFPIDNKNKGCLKSYSDIIEEKNKRNINQKIMKYNNKNNQISFFQLIRFQKFYQNSFINKNINKQNMLSNNFVITSLGEKNDNLPYKIFNEKYFIKLQYDSNYTCLLVIKINDQNYIKKVIIEEKFDNFKIVEDSIFLIKNYTNIFCLSDFSKLLKNNNEKIKISITKMFSLRIPNFKSIPVMYDWPIIQNYHLIFYYLVKNYIFSFEIKHNEFLKKNSEVIIIDKNCFLSKIIYKEKHFFKNEFFFTNFIISIKYIVLFNIDGKILFVNRNDYQIKNIIYDKLSFPIIDILKIKKNIYLLQNSIHSIYLFDKYNKNIMELYISSKNNNLVFNQNIMYFDNKTNLIFFVNEYNEIIFYSLLDKKIIKILHKKNIEQNNIFFLIDNFEIKFIISI